MKFNSPYIAFSAPSGAGKTTIVNLLYKKYQKLIISVSATTREKRSREIEGKSYYFISAESFKKAVNEGKFLEYEEVHGEYYGTLKEKVESSVHSGYTVLFDIDVKGARSIKENYPEALLIFIKPPHKQELVNRLRKRKTENKTSINKRLERLEYEYDQARYFDHIVINDHLEDTLAEVESIICKK